MSGDATQRVRARRDARTAGSAPQRWVLMGDPAHFSVKGGANPHTRTRWGTRRHVDRARAIVQWHGLRRALEDLGIRVLVVPPVAAWPGSVYPANAGFMLDVDVPRPLSEKRFYLSNLLPSRAGEKPHYARALAEAGIASAEIDPALRFEGEADFFPVADRYVLTHGRLERQRFVPTLGIPPWKRVYGFRTDARVEAVLAPLVAPKPVLRAELVLEAHYHGDTALCAFGPRREHLLVYPAALAPESWQRVRETFGEACLELDEADARRYAANAFPYTPPEPASASDASQPSPAPGPAGASVASADPEADRDARHAEAPDDPHGPRAAGAPGRRESFLILPGGVCERLLDRIRERGVTPLPVDVSEFLKKGGGSVKCMIGDLGVVSEPR